MKTDKFVTPLIAVSVIATLLFFTDMTSYALGNKSFLLGKKTSTRRMINQKLDKISDQISNLTARISQMEDVVSKIDSDFNTKIVSLLQKNLDEDRFQKTPRRKLVSHRGDFLNSSSRTGGARNYPDESNKNDYNDYSIFPPKRHTSKRFSETSHESNSFSTDFNTGRTISRPFSPPSKPKTYQWNDSPFPHNSETYSGRFNIPKLGFNTPHNHGSFRPTRLFKNRPLFISNNPDTSQRDDEVIVRKLSVAFDNPKKSSKIPSGTDSRMKMSEIFPDLRKEDPVVEIKKFDDLESFEMFHNDLKNDIVRDNDGSHTSFTKMSKILGYKKPENGAGPHLDSLPDHEETAHKVVEKIEKEIAKISENIEKDQSGREAENQPLSEAKAENSTLPGQITSDDLKQPAAVSSAAGEVSIHGPVPQDLDSIDPFDIDNGQQKVESYFQQKKETLADVINDMEAIKDTISSSNLSTSNKNATRFCEDFKNPKAAIARGECKYRNTQKIDKSSGNESPLVKDSKNLASKIKSSMSEAEKKADEMEKELAKIQMRLSKKGNEPHKVMDLEEFNKKSLPFVAENAMKDMSNLQESIIKATERFSGKDSLRSGIQEPTDQNII